MNATTLAQYQTGNKAVDWLIARVKVTDHSDADGVYFIGEFNGTIPFSMKQQIKDYFGGKFATMAKELGDRETYSLSVKADFGNYKSNANKVSFFISYIKDY